MVFDTWSGAPIHATTAAQLLATTARHYVYISSRSVYSFPLAIGADESHPVVDADPLSRASDDYARAKRGAEIGILDVFPNALFARAGLILGPHEAVGRLPWWLRRVARGGAVLARALHHVGCSMSMREISLSGRCLVGNKRSVGLSTR